MGAFLRPPRGCGNPCVIEINVEALMARMEDENEFAPGSVLAWMPLPEAYKENL